jgi:plasmid stabilization system protein ParE
VGQIAAVYERLGSIVADNRAAVRRVRHRVRAGVKDLAPFPGSGRPRGWRTREPVLTGLPYLVVGRVAGSRVEILRVLHTARNRPASAS